MPMIYGAGVILMLYGAGVTLLHGIILHGIMILTGVGIHIGVGIIGGDHHGIHHITHLTIHHITHLTIRHIIPITHRMAQIMHPDTIVVPVVLRQAHTVLIVPQEEVTEVEHAPEVDIVPVEIMADINRGIMVVMVNRQV